MAGRESRARLVLYGILFDVFRTKLFSTGFLDRIDRGKQQARQRLCYRSHQSQRRLEAKTEVRGIRIHVAYIVLNLSRESPIPMVPQHAAVTSK
jgi:hypothetical protein